VTRTRLEDMAFDVMALNLGLGGVGILKSREEKRSNGIHVYQQEVCCRVTISCCRLGLTRMRKRISLKGGTA